MQKESKKIDATNRVAFYGGIKNGAPQEIIISEAIKNSRGTEYGLEVPLFNSDSFNLLKMSFIFLLL